ncbi:nitrite reductase small subunit NirD [Actinacidiphila alni]|uniref:nitrite reductase small subunit NirD n=1 Tax=Actinacidiphila alni TaxID=380248 RepID=UPI0033EBFC04
MTIEITETVAMVRIATGSGWLPVCSSGLVEPGRAVVALLPDGAQAAVFRVRGGALHAIGNVDPFTGAGVLAHGLTGAVDGRPYVASPLLKQRFDLASGRCLDDDAVAVPVYQVVER